MRRRNEIINELMTNVMGSLKQERCIDSESGGAHEVYCHNSLQWKAVAQK